MLIFCGIWPHGRILSLIDSLTRKLLPMVKRLLLLPKRLVLFRQLLVALFKLVSGPLIALGRVGCRDITTDSDPLLDTVIL